MFTSTPFPQEGESMSQGSLLVRQSMSRGRKSFVSPVYQTFEETRSMMALDDLMGEPSLFETTLGRNRLTMGPPVAEDLLQAMDMLHHQFCVTICSMTNRSQIFEVVSNWMSDLDEATRYQKTNETDISDHHFRKLQNLLRFEYETWNLINCLYFARLNDDGTSTEPFSEIIRDKFCINEGHYVDEIVKSNTTLKEIIIILEWLETNYQKHGDPDLSEKTFIWENTWDVLKRDRLLNKSSSSSLVSQIDPDAPTREGKQLHPLDDEENKKVLRGTFHYIRTGRIDKAIAYLVKSGDRMKAAGLTGYQFTSKTAMEPEIDEELEIRGLRTTTAVPSKEYLPRSNRQPRPNPDFDIVGNRKRDLWKHVTWQICEKNGMAAYDRALLGSVCGHLQSMLNVAQTWEDRLWSFLKATLDVTIEGTLRKLSNSNNRKPLPDSYWSQRLTVQQCIEKVDAFNKDDPRLTPEYFFQLLQKCIMMDKVDTFIEALQGRLQQLLEYSDHPLLNSHLARFYCHLLLFLAIVGLPSSQELIDASMDSYIAILVDINLFTRIPFYVQHLSTDKQIPTIVRHINTNFIFSRDEVAEFLQGCQEYDLDVLAIGMAVVDKMREEQDDFAVENLNWINSCYNIVQNSAQVMHEFLKYTIQISRKYLTLGNIEKVKNLIDQLTPENVSEVRQMSETLENTLVREYLCYKMYLDAEDALTMWKKALSQRPAHDMNELPLNATTADRTVYQNRKQEQDVLDLKWRRAVDFHLNNAIEKFSDILKFPLGWLRECYDPTDEDEAIHVGAVRRIIIRKVVHILLRLVMDKNDNRTIRDFVYVICDDSRLILPELSTDEIANVFKVMEQFTRQKVSNIMFLPK